MLVPAVGTHRCHGKENHLCSGCPLSDSGRIGGVDRGFPKHFVLSSGGGDAQASAISVTIKGFSRPVLHALLQLHPKEPLVHFHVCHFKSKGPTDLFREPWYKNEVHGMHHAGSGAAVSTIRRTADAAAMRVILDVVMKDTDQPVIVMGDINDGQNSNAQNILTRTTWLPVWRGEGRKRYSAVQCADHTGVPRYS